VKKPKKKTEAPAPKKDKAVRKEVADATEQHEGGDAAAAKPKRKRRHAKSGPREGLEAAEPNEAMEVDA
jgi:U3 small nucleolar RNA-associated protein 23